MKYFRFAIGLALAILTPLSASATGCPTKPPTFYVVVNYAGTNCSSSFFGTTCAIAQPVQFTAAWPGFGDPLQACDVITWSYGDGTTETKAPGELTATHSYASSGTYPITLSITNSLGTQTFFYSTPTISVANGYFQLTTDSCCNGPRAAEGLPVSFPVQRTSGTGAASVQYATSDISAVAGVNYVASTGTVTFAPGEVQKTITVPTIDDGVFHSDLFFRMSLSSPTGGFLLRNSDMTATIADADPRPVLGFESSTYTVSEGAGSVDIRVLRSVVTSSTVSVAYQFQNSSNKAATVGSSGVLTFFAGETVKTITVPILSTPNYDGDRSISLGLFSPTNGATFGQNGSGASSSITVKDNQPEPVVVFSNVSVVEGNSGTTVVNAGVTLTNPAGFDVSVRPILSDGTARIFRDYNYSQNSTFVIPAGQTTGTFPVQILGNTTVETNKRFVIAGVANRTDCCSFASVRTQSGTGTILNDDVSISPARISIVVGDVGNIIASFGDVPASAQTVTLSSSDPTVATVAASVSVNTAGASIDVTAKAVGMTTITATVPAAYGGGTFTTDVYVVNKGATLVLSPATVSVPAGGTATISASFSPSLQAAETVILKPTGDGAISVTDRIVIDPAQVSSFTVKGLTRGTVFLKATLGPSQNNAVSFIRIDVTSPATTPAITQLVPANGPSAGGTNVTLNGANLRADCTVRFGGVPASNVAFVGANAITVTTPPFAAGPADVSLSCGSDAFVLPSGFTYLAATPTLSNVTPSFGSTSGGTLVKITGTNIGTGCWPFFDNIPASVAVVKSSTEITASVPSHTSPSTVALALRCPGGAAASLANAFTYSSATESPVITNIDPLIGSAGKSVTISGARFRFDDRVTFDATAATVLETSPETHVVRIPDLPLGKTSITVTDAGNHASTTGPIFTIVEPQPPQITTVSPSTTRPGNEVALEGSGFRPGYSFSIGGLPSVLVSLSYTRVVIRIPQLAPGSYPINVLNSASAIASVGPSVTILKAGLAITGATPVCARTDGGGQMTITGTGFAAGAVVTFDGAIAAGTTVIDAQTINVTLPILAAGTPRIVVTNANGDTASLSNAFTVTSPFAPDGCTSRLRPSKH